VSEGGFEANRVSNAALLGVATEKDKKGKTYYKFEILTRTGALLMLPSLDTSTCVDVITVNHIRHAKKDTKGRGIECAFHKCKGQ
jgi:hypothetical protein